MSAPSGPLFRIDKFAVPSESRAEFLSLVGRTHQLLREQSGFVRDLILDQVSGPGRYNIVTFVEWADETAYAAAGEAVRTLHREIGFDAQSATRRLGIEADIGTYRSDLRPPAPGPWSS